MHAIALSESLVAPGLVLIHANCQVVRHPDVENAGLAGHDVDEEVVVAHVVSHRCIHDTRRKQQIPHSADTLRPAITVGRSSG